MKLGIAEEGARTPFQRCTACGCRGGVGRVGVKAECRKSDDVPRGKLQNAIFAASLEELIRGKGPQCIANHLGFSGTRIRRLSLRNCFATSSAVLTRPTRVARRPGSRPTFAVARPSPSRAAMPRYQNRIPLHYVADGIALSQLRAEMVADAKPSKIHIINDQ